MLLLNTVLLTLAILIILLTDVKIISKSPSTLAVMSLQFDPLPPPGLYTTEHIMF